MKRSLLRLVFTTTSSTIASALLKIHCSEFTYSAKSESITKKNKIISIICLAVAYSESDTSNVYTAFKHPKPVYVYDESAMRAIDCCLRLIKVRGLTIPRAV